MRLDRRLILIGVMLVVLSMTMATQYATTRVSYSFAIVHPSIADIRFVGSDNSSDDNTLCLRVTDNTSGGQFVTLELGDWMPDSKVNYTAAFGIVNEQEQFVNLTHVNVTGTNLSYLSIWLHHDRDDDYDTDDAANEEILVVRNGVALYDASDTLWTFAPGDGDPGTMSNDYATDDGVQTHFACVWDATANVYKSYNDANNSVNKSADFVWVGISLDIPTEAKVQAATGTIYLHFKADDQTGDGP